jgi:hypothetical protein
MALSFANYARNPDTGLLESALRLARNLEAPTPDVDTINTIIGEYQKARDETKAGEAMGDFLKGENLGEVIQQLPPRAANEFMDMLSKQSESTYRDLAGQAALMRGAASQQTADTRRMAENREQANVQLDSVAAQIDAQLASIPPEYRREAFEGLMSQGSPAQQEAALRTKFHSGLQKEREKLAEKRAEGQAERENFAQRFYPGSPTTGASSTGGASLPQAVRARDISPDKLAEVLPQGEHVLRMGEDGEAYLLPKTTEYTKNQPKSEQDALTHLFQNKDGLANKLGFGAYNKTSWLIFGDQKRSALTEKMSDKQRELLKAYYKGSQYFADSRDWDQAILRALDKYEQLGKKKYDHDDLMAVLDQAIVNLAGYQAGVGAEPRPQ